jgi:oligopeptide transport system substrate-binding protein
VGINAPDDSTLVIRLGRPTPYFLSLIAHHSWFPVHPPTILKYGKIDQRGTPWTRAGNFIGNGQFNLNNWEINKVISVKKSQTYWDANAVRLNEIHFHPIENNLTEERSFRTGQLHITSNVPPGKIEWYKNNNPKVLRIDPYLGTYYYIVNINNKPINDLKVRRALALAIDRRAITEHILKGGQIPAGSFTPPNTGNYSFDQMISFDTTEARKLLLEAGFSEANPFPAISLLYNTSESHHTVAQAIQQMWKKHLGINVTLINQEWKVYLSSTQQKNYDIARKGWIGDYNDPNSFLDMWVTGGGNNNTGWSNTAYDSLITAASQTADQIKRIELFKNAEHILMNELPVIPIYFYTNVISRSSWSERRPSTIARSATSKRRLLKSSTKAKATRRTFCSHRRVLARTGWRIIVSSKSTTVVARGKPSIRSLIGSKSSSPRKR